VFEPPQGWGLPPCPGQPGPTPDRSSRTEIVPDLQPEPPLTHPEAVSSARGAVAGTGRLHPMTFTWVLVAKHALRSKKQDWKMACAPGSPAPLLLRPGHEASSWENWGVPHKRRSPAITRGCPIPPRALQKVPFMLQVGRILFPCPPGGSAGCGAVSAFLFPPPPQSPACCGASPTQRRSRRPPGAAFRFSPDPK